MLTVLVVEDEPLIAMALEAELTDAGYAVVTAMNGRAALERLAQTPRPDVVLTDIMMPVMGGAEMVSAMRADPMLRTLPVIVMSSLPRSTVRDKVDGVAAVLRKPATADEILRAIGEAIGSST